jgi:Xaa-Pro aminopeptidase
MFQSFEDFTDPTKGAERVVQLRAELKHRKLASFLVPRTDEYQNEYVPPAGERLYWLTGFSGSAGLAVIQKKQAALFVDGRYTLQARNQVDGGAFEVLQTPNVKPTEWLVQHAKKGDRVGYDPRLHTMAEIARLERALAPTGAKLAPQKTNPVDAVWQDRPDPPMGPVVPHGLEYSGKPAAEKIADLKQTLRQAKQDAVLLTQPESIAWAFNIRGSDVPHTPLALSFAILHAKKKLSDNVRGVLAEYLNIRQPDQLGSALKALGKAKAKVRLDSRSAPCWFGDQLAKAGAKIVEGADPCLLPKAIKNSAEIDGARAAHIRDGAALCRFFAWLDREAPSGKVDEIRAAERLEAFRAETGRLKDLSFDTISGAGPNGAIVHYRVSRASSRGLEPGSLYLVDSGAQYVDGTTDVTRTIAIGEPTQTMRRHFTLVLKGHIAVATARFPKGTRGQDLDPFARRPLWQAGLDFDHGAGHGVGSYLSVHEGPQRISRLGAVPLEPGMICSNEPGYYREGDYGIRIENLVLVTGLEKIEGGEREMMGFETLTLAPIDRRLIDTAMLTSEELDWLNGYHARVRETAGPIVDEQTRKWLEVATAALG